MSLNGAVPTPATHPLAAGRLGASALVFFALAAAAPLTVVTAVVPSAYASADATVVPVAFLGLGLILLLFSVGYAAMARRAPHAGALYSFIARGLGRPVGVGGAWLALLSYNAIQIGLYGAAGVAAAPLLDLWFGVSADWWMVATGCWVVVALCGLLRVDITGGLLAVVVLAEAAVITGFAAANLLEPGDAITWRTVVPTDWAGIDRPALGLLLVMVAFAFVGFETTAAYGEEARRPRRSVTRATAIAVGLLALLHVVSAGAAGIGAGSGRISGLAAGRGSELLFDLAGARLAPWAVTLGRVLVLTGLLAAMISLHSTIARYVFALGRERLLPTWLGRTTRRGSVPLGGSVAQSLVAAAALGGVYAAGWDPLTQTFHWLTTAGALGVLLLLLAASLAALLFLNRAPNDESAWQRFVAPGLATVLIGALCYLAFSNLGELLGVPSGAALLVVVPVAVLAAVLFGVGHGFMLRALGPIVYAGIGLGGTAVVVTPEVPRPREPGAHRPERIDRATNV